jgi:hypothetical protein
MRFHPWLSGTVLALSTALASCAEPGPAPPPVSQALRGDVGRVYDPSTVETVAGEVLGVERVPSRRGWRADGVRVVLATPAAGTLSVHLGPAWFVDAQEMAVEPGTPSR